MTTKTTRIARIACAACIGALTASAVAQTCDPTEIFAPQVRYDAGQSPRGVAIGDLNGDGHPDLVVGNRDANAVSVLLNTGDGTFAPPVRYSSTGFRPIFVVIGDLDGDGDNDLATANFDGSDVSVLLNNGDGTFGPARRYRIGEFPGHMAIGDLDGDGDNDLVTASNVTGVSMLLNNGDGTFGPFEIITTGIFGRWRVAIGDLDGDGDNDIVATNPGEDNIGVLLNNGDATFAPEVGYDADGVTALVAIGDLNGDGYLDLATGEAFFPPSGAVTVLLNNGDGTFALNARYEVGGQPNDLAIGDLNGDGDNDLAVPKGGATGEPSVVSVLLNNGDGTLAPEVSYGVGSSPLSVAIGDLDSDGDNDLVTLNTYVFDPGLSVLLNQCGTSTCPADLDGDGELTFFDFLAFQNLFDLMDPRADFDGDGEFTFFDFLAFQNAFDVGCP